MSTINLAGGNTLLQSGSFPPVRVASTGSPLNPATGGLLTVDGIALVVGDRVLCKDETSAVNNGIYAAQTGPWVRTADASTNTQFFSGMNVTVALGTVNAGNTFRCTCSDDPVVVGTSLLTWSAAPPVGGGNVIGPGSSTTGYVATFANTTGLLLQATSTTGSGQVVYSVSPTLTTPTLGVATATTINNVTITQPASSAAIGITNAKTFNVSNSLTLAGTDGKTFTFNASLTLSGTDGKTLTLDNSLEFAGNDGTKFTFPSANDTIVGITATQTLTNKTLTSPTISGGTVDNAIIGGSVSAAGTFTSLTAASGTFTKLYSTAPLTLSGTSGTITSTTTILNPSGTFTVTFPLAGSNTGQFLYVKSVTAHAVNSATSNVGALNSATATSALFTGATSGDFASMQSDGTLWQIMAGVTT